MKGELGSLMGFGGHLWGSSGVTNGVLGSLNPNPKPKPNSNPQAWDLQMLGRSIHPSGLSHSAMASFAPFGGLDEAVLSIFSWSFQGGATGQVWNFAGTLCSLPAAPEPGKGWGCMGAKG